MSIVRLVAADALDRSLPPRLARLVAVVARECTMPALERKVGQLMIEARATELHDIGIPALVLGVACAAFTRAGVGHPTVVAMVVANVRLDILVAIETQR